MRTHLPKRAKARFMPNGSISLRVKEDVPRSAENPDGQRVRDVPVKDKTKLVKLIDNGGMRFKRGKNADLRSQIDAVLNTDRKAGEVSKRRTVVKMSRVPASLIRLGLPDAEIETRADIVRKIHTQHGLSAAQIADIPARIDSPAAVLKDGKDFIVLTDLEAKTKHGEDKPVMVLLRPWRNADGSIVFLASAYPREAANENKYINIAQVRGNTLFVDKNKIAAIGLEERTISTLNTPTSHGVSTDSISQTGTEGNGVTPAEDAAYMDAVQRGDMETAQEMVRPLFEKYAESHKISIDEASRLFAKIAKATYDRTTYFEVYGIRGDQRLLVPDDAFPNSHSLYEDSDRVEPEDWDDEGNPVFKMYEFAPELYDGGELPGTSTLGLDEDDFDDEKHLAEKIKEALEQEYAHENEYVYLVGGDDAGWGEDVGERLISDAEVLSVLCVVSTETEGTYPNRKKSIFYTNKSADAVTYDNTGNVIPLSQRFNPEKADLRFKRGENDLKRDYDEVVRRYTNADGTKKRGWMRAPNGQPTRLTERQWVQVRTPAFKEWFGDWERNAELNAARDLALNGSPVSIITGQEFQKDPSGKNSLVDRVSSYFDEIGGKAESPILGTVELNRRGVKSSMAHGIGSGKAAAFAAVKDVIEKGVVFDRNDNWKGRGYGTAAIAAPIRIGNSDYVCELVVNRYADRNAFYLHEVNLRERLSDTIKTATGAVSIGESARPVRSIIAQRLSENNPASKVVDENGEPLVVYHGTKDDFTAFTDGQGKRYDAGYLGRGFYFTNREESGRNYAEWKRGFGAPHTMTAFLSIKNPLVLAGKGPNLSVVQNALGMGEPEDTMSVTTMQAENIRSETEKRGYDGIIRRLHDGETIYVAFEPTQIKSATDNTGAFDGAERDIRFKRGENERAADDTSVWFGAKASMAAHGFDARTAKEMGLNITNKGTVAVARSLVADVRRMAEIETFALTSNRPLAADRATTKCFLSFLPALMNIRND